MSQTPPPPYGEPQPGQQPGQPGQQPGQPYGQQPQVPYGQPTYGYGQPAYGPIAPDHPQATTVLILGILGLVVCGLLAPFAWVMGNRVVGEIDASNGTIGGRSSANAGRICGIVGTVLIGLALLMVVLLIILAVVGAFTATAP